MNVPFRPVIVCVLLFQVAGLGADYHVDAANGHDGNSGLNPTAAWRTIARVNSSSFAPGDRILLRRGQTWREQLIVPSSGVAGQPITIGAYGEGDRPVLKGSALVSSWTAQGSDNIWQAPLSTAPSQVFFDGVRGTKESTVSNLNAARKWYWSSGVLYVYATSNPGGSTVEASVRPAARTYGLLHVQNRSYVTVESIEVTQSNSFGLYLKPSGQYLTVRDCEVSHSRDGGLVAANAGGAAVAKVTVEDCLVHHNNGGFKEGAPGVETYHEGLTMELVDGFTIRGCQVYANYMEGVNFKRGARNGLIENCRLYANGLINQYMEGATNIEFRYNRVYDCTYNAGVEFGLETNSYHNDNVKIHHNLFWNNTGGVSFWAAGGATAQTRNIQIHNNTFYNNGYAIRWKSGATDNYSGTNSLKNNVIWQRQSYHYGIGDETSGDQGIARTAIAYNVFQSGARNDATGSSALVLTDPYFANAGASDFHLRSGSRCIDSGTSLGAVRDFDGNKVPQGAGPDRGAYEYGSTTTITTYTLTTSATNGTITRTPNQTSYASGTTVSLQATANSGYTFSGWSGDLTGTTNPATLVMDSNKSVTANFTVSGGTTPPPTSTTKTVGNTTVFSRSATIPNRRAMPYTMAEAGQLQSVSIYHNGGSGRMLLAVYADSSGKPGTRLGVTSTTTVKSTQGWQTIALPSPVSVSKGQKIWLAWVFENSPAVRYTAGTPGRAQASATWSGGMPSTFGSSTIASYIYSIYATYTAGSTTTTPTTGTKTVGNTTVFSSTTTVAKRRAAPYTMAEAGQLQSVSIYHQGGSGQMLLAVYADSSGKPGTRLGVTNPTTVKSTQGWQTIALQSPVSVSKGQKIWLAWVFQNMPVIRAKSGTPGRAESSATWSGGMPSTFGSSTIASYLYSIYASYTPVSTTAAVSSVQVMAEGDVQLTAEPPVPADGQSKKSKTIQAAARQLLSEALAGVIEKVAGAETSSASSPDQTDSPALDQNAPAEQAGLNPGQVATVGDSQGRIWAVWHAGPDGQRQVYAACLTPDAAAYSETVQLSQGSGDHCEPAVALDAAGTLYAVWQENAQGLWRVCLSSSRDGRSWSVPQPIADSNDNQTNPALAAGSAGTLVALAWQEDRAGNPDIYVAGSRDGFATTQVSQVTFDEADQTEPAVAVDGSDTIFVLWTDARHGTLDIYGAASDEGPWANVPITAGASNQSQPAVAVGSRGSVLHLAWVDDLGGDADIFYAASAGLPPAPLAGTDLVDDPSGAEQVAPGIVVTGPADGTEQVFVSWQDGRHAAGDGRMDVYFAEVRADAPVVNERVGNETAEPQLE